MHPYLQTGYAALQAADTVLVHVAVPGHRVVLQSLVCVLRDGLVFVEGLDGAGIVTGRRGSVVEGFNVFETIGAEAAPFVVGRPGEGMRLRSESGDDVEVTFTYYVGPA